MGKDGKKQLQGIATLSFGKNQKSCAFFFLKSLFFPVGVLYPESRVLCGESLSCTRFWCLGKRQQIQQWLSRAALKVGEQIKLF